jgi:hypothetical protein
MIGYLLVTLLLPLVMAAETLIVYNPLAYHLTIKAIGSTATTLENVCLSVTTSTSLGPCALEAGAG